MNLKYIETREIAVGDLEEHPDSAQPGDDGDRCFITASMPEQGQMQPVTVVLQGDGYKIVDGIGRWQAAKKAGWAKVRCEVMEIRDTRAAALTANGMGRKRSTGASILAYLESNVGTILQLQREEKSTVSRDTVKDKGGRRKLEDPFAKHYSVAGIAERLGASNKDVGLAMELMLCHVKGRDPVTGEALDDAGVEKMRSVYDGVMRTQTPIRRWRAAWAGKKVVQEGCGKDNVNLPAHARRICVGLKTVFERWTETEFLSDEDREGTVEALLEAMEIMPEFLRAALIQIIPDTWNAPARKALEKALKAVVK